MLVKRLISMALLAASAASALPVVTDVVMTQRTGARIVDITYTLAGAESAIITLAIETNGVALPAEAVTELDGDVCARVQPGVDKRIVWQAGIDWPENANFSVRPRITAWATNSPPPYMVVDLCGGASGLNYPVRYYPSENALPYGGVTNDLYKTVLMAFRHVRAGSFWMGASPYEPIYTPFNDSLHRVTMTNDFFIGVYEVTQAQWCQVAGTKPSGWKYVYDAATRPVERVSYRQVRECDVAENRSTEINWPLTGNAVGAGSFADRLRSRSGLSGFDLPTDAQWEYAARAGTLRSINILGGVNVTNVDSDANMSRAGRYRYNGGYGANNSTNFVSAYVAYGAITSAASATAKVGSYLPNAWGLYDMQGNVHEWVRDYYMSNLGSDPVVEPVGANSGNRVLRGMSFGVHAQNCRVSTRQGWHCANSGSHGGFRMACDWR